MKPFQSISPPTLEFRLLIGGSLEESIGEFFGKTIEQHLGKPRVSVRTVEHLHTLLEEAAQSPPDLIILYLHFFTPADEAVADSPTCRAELFARLTESCGEPCYVSNCGLRLVTHLKSICPSPLFVLTGCGDARGRARRIEQAGANAFLPLPASREEFVRALDNSFREPS